LRERFDWHACANRGTPNGLTEDERRIAKRNRGFFVTADSLSANNILLDAGKPSVSATPGLRRGDPHQV
jgi:hypothetical protein